MINDVIIFVNIDNACWKFNKKIKRTNMRSLKSKNDIVFLNFRMKKKFDLNKKL